MRLTLDYIGRRGAWVRRIVVRCCRVVYGRFLCPMVYPVFNSMENERNNSLRQSVIFYDDNIFIYNDNSLRCHFQIILKLVKFFLFKLYCRELIKNIFLHVTSGVGEWIQKHLRKK